MTALPTACVLVRTWFGDDRGWESLVREVETPSDEGFLASVVPVDDPAFEGLSAGALRAKQPDGSVVSVSFLADETTFGNAEHPILAVWLNALGDDDDQRDLAPFRVVPAALWSVENNINLANMDWEEFRNALDEAGVFRGF